VAANFRITVQRKGDDLHLSLHGDFDGTSAFELLQALGQSGSRAERVVVDTDRLCTVLPFGREVFQRQYGVINSLPARIRFTGPHRGSLAPAGRG
jgi:hypothetical protein